MNEQGTDFLRKTLINTEESYQTGFGKERRLKSFVEKDGLCLKKSLIKTGWVRVLFLSKGIVQF